MRKIGFAALVLGLGGILGVTHAQIIKSQDEGPIIVQNGSMTIDTKGGEWQKTTGAWKNVTGKDNKGELWVRVDLTGGTCKGSGHPVQVEYSVNGFKAIFDIAGNPPHTTAAPRGRRKLERVTKERLTHGSSGGFINGVKIPGSTFNCTITKENLKAVNICSSPDVPECK
jgi:hypothetical protein